MTGQFRHVWKYFPIEVLTPLTDELPDDLSKEIYFEIEQILLREMDEVYLEEKSALDVVVSGLRAKGRSEKEIMRELQRETENIADLGGTKKYLSDFSTPPVSRNQLSALLGAGQTPNETPDISMLERLSGIELPGLFREKSVLKFMADIYARLEDYDERLPTHYKNLIRGFIWQHNLSYEVREPFEIRPLIVLEFDRIYRKLKKTKGTSGDLLELLGDFEHSYAAYLKDHRTEDLHNALSKVFCYLEGAAGEKISKRGKTLGDLAKECETMRLLPHRGSLSNSLSNFYGFPSNFPRLRHAGTPASKIRDLDLNDCTGLSLLALVWAGYINDLPLPIVQDNEAEAA